jgi:hypothetical protein
MTSIESTALPSNVSVAGASQGTAAAPPPTSALTPRQVKQATRGVYRLRRHLRVIRMTLNAMLILALLYTVTIVKALIIPLVLAAFIGLALNPIVARGTRHHIPRWLGASVLMVTLRTGYDLAAYRASYHPQFHPQAGTHHPPARSSRSRYPDAGERSSRGPFVRTESR